MNHDSSAAWSEAKINIAVSCLGFMALAFFQLSAHELFPMLLFGALASLATWAITTGRRKF